MARTQISGGLIKDGTIAGVDLAPAASGQILVANGSGILSPVNMSGDATISNTGVVTVGGGGDPSFKRVSAKNTTATLTVNDAGLITVDASAGAPTLTLPAANTCSGYTFTFIKIDASVNDVIIGSGSATISGKTSFTLGWQYQSVTIKSNGTTFYVTGGGPIFSELTTSEMASVYNPTSGIFESINRYQMTFQSSSNGTRNVYLLNYGTFTSQSPTGFYVPRNAIIKGIWATVGANTTSTCAFQIMKNGSATVLASATIPNGSMVAFAENINLQLTAGDKVSLFISNTANVATPQCTVELAWKD